MKLIDKDALVAEIERIKEIYCYDTKTNASFVAKAVINSINNAINSLEVKEVDLEKEINNFGLHYDGIVLDRKELIEFAKHFFDFGMSVSNKAQKGE